MSLSFIYTFFIIYGLSITPLLADKDSPPIVGIIVSFVVALFFSFITVGVSILLLNAAYLQLVN